MKTLLTTFAVFAALTVGGFSVAQADSGGGSDCGPSHCPLCE